MKDILNGWKVMSGNFCEESDKKYDEKMERYNNRGDDGDVVEGRYGMGTDVIVKFEDIYIWEYENDEDGEGVYVVERI